MMSERSTTDLPEDLVVEILSRVPTSSLARLRSISKGWNALVKDGSFAKKHSANAQRQSLVILLIDFRVYLARVDLRGIQDNVVPSAKVTSQFRLKDPLYNSSKEVDISDVFHCEGFLLCTTDDKRLVVWNPCSGETRWIQPRNSYKESDYYAFGYDSKSSCYKILRMDQFEASPSNKTECEVYDFSSNAWRVVGVTTDWYIPLDGVWNRGTYVKGNTYWLACSNDDKRGVFLLSFDFSTERFPRMSLPPDLPFTEPFWKMFLSVTREDQQLCMSVTYGLEEWKTDIWMATRYESTGAMSWTKFLTLLECPLESTMMSSLIDLENKVVLSCNKPSQFSNNIIHIAGEDKNIKVDLHRPTPTHRSPTPFLFSYVPSFVQIQQDISSSLEEVKESTRS